jgi:hypothetical protein
VDSFAFSSPVYEPCRAEERRTAINAWLNPPDPSTNFKAAFSKRQARTGDWFVQGDIFTTWKTYTAYPLWLHGGGEFCVSTLEQELMECHSRVREDNTQASDHSSSP